MITLVIPECFHPEDASLPLFQEHLLSGEKTHIINDRINNPGKCVNNSTKPKVTYQKYQGRFIEWILLENPIKVWK